MKRNNRMKHISDFTAHLRGLVRADNKEALAALRRAARSKRYANMAIPYVAYVLPQWKKDVDTYLCVASLYAEHPLSTTEDTNFGDQVRALRQHRSPDAIDRRFKVLINARNHQEKHIRAFVQMLETEQIPIQWEQLLYDMLYWNHPDQFVQYEWSMHYWANNQRSQDES